MRLLLLFLVRVSLYIRRERRSDTVKRKIMTIENLFVHLLQNEEGRRVFSCYSIFER